jgi:hypothetical protein
MSKDVPVERPRWDTQWWSGFLIAIVFLLVGGLVLTTIANVFDLPLETPDTAHGG